MLISSWYLKPPADKKRFALTSVFLGLVALTVIITAVLLSLRCNANQTLGMKIGIAALAVLFPEIYIIQYLLRRYLFKEPQYCVGAF